MREEQDKKLADKGWHSMQQLLERDMPTERKRRPLAWWWLGLLLLPLAIWGGSLWWNAAPEQPAPQLPAQQQQDRPVVQRGMEQPTIAGNSDTEARDPEQVGANFPSHETTSTDASPGTVIRPRRFSGQLLQTTPNATQHISDNQQVTGIAPALTGTEPNAGTIIAEPSISRSFTNALALPFDAARSEQPVSFAIPHTDIIKPVHSSTADDASKLPARWSLGLTVAASTEGFVSLNGISAGLTTDWQFARKWGLRSSLLYTRYLPSASKQPVVAVEEVRYSNATGLFTGNGNIYNGSPIAPTAGENQMLEYVYIPLRKLHQIELPLMAYWQPLRSLRLYSGVALDYTFYGQTASNNYINSQPVTLADYVTKRGASRVATDELSPLQLHYQGGLGLQLGRHVEISAFWRQPIYQVLPKTQALDAANNSLDPSPSYDPQESADLQNTTATPVSRSGRFVLQGTWKF